MTASRSRGASIPAAKKPGMRLFIAIAIPEEIRAAYAGLIQEFRELAPQAKWVRGENLHVTLKFLGETPPAKWEELRSALVEIHSPEPVKLEFQGLGFFPNERRPRVLWAGMEAPARLKMLAGDVDRVAHALGFPLEERPFTPHLTLARFNPLTAMEFQVIESKLKSAGAEYTTLQTYGFAPEG